MEPPPTPTRKTKRATPPTLPQPRPTLEPLPTRTRETRRATPPTLPQPRPTPEPPPPPRTRATPPLLQPRPTPKPMPRGPAKLKKKSKKKFQLVVHIVGMGIVDKWSISRHHRGRWILPEELINITTHQN